MPDEAEFEAALAQIKSFTDALDLDLKDPIKGHQEDLGEVRHLPIDSEGDRIYCTAVPNKEYFVLSYPYSVTGQVSSRISTEEAELVLDKGLESIDEEEGVDQEDLIKREAAQELLRHAENDQIQSLRYSLELILSGSELTFDSYSELDQVGFTNFNLKSYIYPYEPDFSISSFGDKFRRLAHTGSKGASIVAASITIEQIEEGEIEDSLTITPRV